MTERDMIGLVISFLYAGGLVLGTELIHRFLHIPQALTRKIVHIGAGMWVWGVLALFDSWYIGLIPYAAFIFLNYMFYRHQIFRALEDPSRSLGTVYFALIITLLYALFWRPDGPIDRAHAATAGVMALTWGDALAALIGQYFGKHRYTIGISQRSWEGSITMVLVSVVAILITLLVLPGSALSPYGPQITLPRALITALVAGILATIVEACSPRGTDNLGIPVVVAGVVLFLTYT